MKKIVPIILIIGGLVLGYLGFNQLQGSKSGIEIGNLEIKAEDKDSSSTAYFMLGTALALVVGGAVIASKGES